MKTYNGGTCYIGVVGAEMEIGECRDSIDAIKTRPGDTWGRARATKGYEGRQYHFDNFVSSQHEWMLLLDSDMVFEADTLERLRSHGVPYVSGYYMRRRYAPIAPVWFEPQNNGEWPLLPWVKEPERGRLHLLGASGWGCVLLHRDVVISTRRVLRGQKDVLEDAMELWPYDVDAVLKAVNALAEWQDTPDERMSAAGLDAINTLRAELRPLRIGRETITGSDIRYPFFARQAGFDLYGDPDVRPGHVLFYPLSPNDYSALPAEVKDNAAAQAAESVTKMRAAHAARLAELTVTKPQDGAPKGEEKGRVILHWRDPRRGEIGHGIEYSMTHAAAQRMVDWFNDWAYPVEHWLEWVK